MGLQFVGCTWHSWSPAHLLPICLVKAHLCAWFQKSSSQPCLLTRLYWSMSNMLKEERKLGEAKSMVWLLLLRSVAKRVGHAEEKEKKEAKSIRPCGVLKQKQRAEAHRVSAIFVWVLERAKTQKIESFSWRCSPKNREKHSESVREWKRKRRHFFLCSSYTQGR